MQVVVTVADKDTLMVVLFIMILGKGAIGRVILQAERKALGKFSGRVDLPRQDVPGGLSDRFSGQVGFHDCWYPVRPRHFHYRPVLQNYGDIGVGLNDLRQQLILVGWQGDGILVKALRFHALWEAGKEDDPVTLLRQLDGLRSQFLVRRRLGKAVASSILRTSRSRSQRSNYVMGINVRTPTALKTWFTG